MKKHEIKVGGLYTARVSGRFVTVRVDAIRDIDGVNRWSGARSVTVYDVTNLATGRKTTFRSAAKFRSTAEQHMRTDPLGQILVEAGRMEREAEQCPVNNYSKGEINACTIEAIQEPDREGRSQVSSQNKEGEGLLGMDREDRPRGIRIVSDGRQDIDSSQGGLDDSQGRSPAGSSCASQLRQSEMCQPRPPVSGNEQGQHSGLQQEGTEERAEGGCLLLDKAIGEGRGGGEEIIRQDQSKENQHQGTGGTLQCIEKFDSTNNSGGYKINNLAAKITAARVTRAVGSPVAGMTPNAEQESILEAAVQDGLRVLVVGAGAGAGKTATLKMLEQVLPGRGQYTAFNTSLVAESKAKFVKAACNTTHSLAFRAVGRTYQHRLGGERMRSGQVARILGIEAMTINLKGAGEPDADGKPTDKKKVLQAEFLAGQVLTAVKRFCQSADREIGVVHLRYIDGIDTDHGRVNNDKVRDYLLPFCAKAWIDLSNVNGQLPYQHDYYVKSWQLGEGNDRPVIAADYILLDEAQDTAPVFLSILQQQTHALLIFIGDSNQAIYEWRGAVDAMKAYPQAERRLLSQSYRFGQAVADVANAVLATLEEPTDLVMRGMPTIPSRVAEVAKPRCYLYRTNAGAVARVMIAIKGGLKPHLIGGGDEVVRWMQAALDLQARRGTRHPELCCFETWDEVEEYSKTDEGSDLRLMVKLVKEFGATIIRDALKDMPKEEQADVVVSTAHKSKGREWDTVKLGPDFPLANKMTDPDRRLLYVAATRAKLTLDISECPPFCGGHDKQGGGEDGDGGSKWIPGIEINYTTPMPTTEDQKTYMQGRADGGAPTGSSRALSADTPTPAVTTKDANGNTWTKGRNGNWIVRGKPGQTGAVTVARKNGTSSKETIKRVIWQDANVALYEV